MYTLVTGASSGIGKAFAQESAARGMNVLLVALPGDDLVTLEKEIRDTYKVGCHAFGTDLSAPGAAQLVHDWVKENNFTVNILINNVGVGSKGPFGQLTPAFYNKQVNLNVLATTLITRLLIEELQRHAPAYILNVGSMGGFYAIPEKVVYAATKAYIYSFSNGLRMELEPSGISVSVVCPGGINSNANTIASNKDLKGIAKASILQPEELAKEALDKMFRKQAVIIPGQANRFIYGLSKIIPAFIQKAMVRRAFSRLKKHEY